MKIEDFTNFKEHSRSKAKKLLIEFSKSLDFSDKRAQFVYDQTMLRVIGKDTKAYRKPINLDDIILTRVRKNCSSGALFENIKDIWLPPESLTNLGRANIPNIPVFYCSDWPGTSIFEVKPNLEEWITTSNFNLKISQLECIVLGADPNILPGFNDLEPFLQGIHDYLREVFTEEINETNLNNYFKTAIICHHFIKDSMGLMYPSFASNLNGWNFVFSEKFANNHIIFSDSRTQRVVHYVDKMNFKIQCLFESNKITEDNDFIWNKISKCNGHFLTETIYNDD